MGLIVTLCHYLKLDLYPRDKPLRALRSINLGHYWALLKRIVYYDKIYFIYIRLCIIKELMGITRALVDISGH